jgi:hypothetical protein
MLSAEQCRDYAKDCVTLGGDKSISLQRATALMAMAKTWSTLANDIERYGRIVQDEEPQRVLADSR